MTKLSIKTNFAVIMVISLLLGGSIGSITKNIELSEKDIDDLQELSLEALQDLGNNPVINEEIRAKVEEITSYEEHDPIVINGNTNFNDTAYAEGWPGNGSIDNPFIIQGLNITGPSGSSLIDIQNTDAYFQINNCLLVGGDYGIYLDNVNYGLISNNTIISNFMENRLFNSANNSFISNTFSDNSNSGLSVRNSVNNTFFNNTFTDNGIGIELQFLSEKNILLNNTFSSNSKYGVGMSSSGNNRIINNTFFNTGIIIFGSLSGYSQAEVTNNTVNGKPLVYWQNINGRTVPNGTGQVILVNCGSVTVTGQNLSDTTVGLQAAYSFNLTIYNNTACNNIYGIFLDNSEYCVLFNNTATYNTEGIFLDSSTNNNLYGNTFSNNSWGIFLDSSANNVLHGNTVSYNSKDGIILYNSANNVLHGNTVSYNSKYGMHLDSSANNAFFSNTVSDNVNYGTYLFFSENNIVTWNDFANNNPSDSSQAHDVSNLGLANTFDYNYWNDWTTPDMNSDGVVDSPYTIDGDSNNQDSHPLTTPSHLSPPAITFPNNGTTLEGVITIQWAPAIDQWGHMITYSVYYSNDSGSTWFSLASGLDTTSYQWDSTTVLDGSEYLLKVVAICSAGLTTEDVTDSTFTIQNALVAPPSAPQSLTATAGELFVYLNWTAPSSDGGSAITGYRVYRGTSSGVYTLIFIASDTHHNDTLVSGDTTYHYVVTAINAVGESDVSSEVNTTPTEPIITQSVAPDAPQSLTATAGELVVFLSWIAPSSDGGSAITGYHVYRGTSSGEYTVTFATLDTNYEDTLVGGVTYYYVVTAINAIGESIFSTEVNATPTEPTTTTTTTTRMTTTTTTTTAHTTTVTTPAIDWMIAIFLLTMISIVLTFKKKKSI